MHAHEEKTLKRIIGILKKKFPQKILSAYAFGSRVRGDFDEWSDFDVLVVVKDKTPSMETEIISLFVDEEIKSGLSFAPVIKDSKTFEREKRFNAPFYENISKEGIRL